MDTPKKFHGSMFGYKKKDVNGYIMENAQRYEQIKNELEEKNKALEAENKALTERVASLEKERAFIADALLNAKLEADKILAEAKAEATRIRANLEIELANLNGEITKEKNRIDEIRNDAKKALNEYISRLDNIDINNGASEDAEKDSEDAAEPSSFEPFISAGDDLESDLEEINAAPAPAEENAYDASADDDENDFEIETIE